MQPQTCNLQPILLRPFRPEDQCAVKALILVGLREHWGPLDPGLNSDLDDIATTYAGAAVVVACQSDRIIGTGVLKSHGATSRGREFVGEIVRMSVAADCRRRGVGRRILDALIEAGREIGYARIILETTQTWDGAIAFYQDAGFETTHHQDGDVYFVMDLTPRP